MTLGDMIRGYVDSVTHHTGLHYVPSFNDLGTNSNDDLEEMEHVANVGNARDQATAPQAAPTKSNKPDHSWPQLETTDIHKINVASHPKAKSQLYDVGKRPSVWEYIIRSEKLKDTNFRAMDQDKDGKLTAADLSRTLKVTESDAARMVAEADKDKDGRINESEYREVLSHYGSE